MVQMCKSKRCIADAQTERTAVHYLQGEMECHVEYHVTAEHYRATIIVWWRGSATGRALDLRSVGRGFKYHSRQRCVTTLGKLFTPMCLCHQAV